MPSSESIQRFLVAKARITGVLAAVLAGGCAGPPGQPKVAEALGVDGKTTSRYHDLAINTHGQGLMHEGYVVAIEKAPTDAIGYRRGAYEARFRYYCDQESGPDCAPGAGTDKTVLAQRARHLRKTIDDNEKAMFVSHILAYEPDPGPVRGRGVPGAQPRMRTRFLYDVYPADYGAALAPWRNGTRVDVPQPDPGAYYESGWQALEQALASELRAKIEAAARSKRPYTHLMIGSMGWDNDQQESLRRYNAIVGQLVSQARTGGEGLTDFNPLVIGITWPSVWGWDSVFDTLQLVYKVVGYGNKADDADEIGYTYGNWLVNRLAMDAKGWARGSGHPIAVVVFGHSFGARIATRSVYSSPLLRQPALGDGEVDLLVGLQGAFSINRFLAKEGNEGSPYAPLSPDGPLVMMTWSDKDKANPLARFLSGARHIGGREGDAKLDSLKHGDADQQALVERINRVATPRVDPCLCQALRNNRDRMLYVDASDYVSDHNDVLDKDVAALFWSAIDCVTVTDTVEEKPIGSPPGD